jgi:type IV secretory pathway TrbF-like protein
MIMCQVENLAAGSDEMWQANWCEHYAVRGYSKFLAFNLLQLVTVMWQTDKNEVRTTLAIIPKCGN